MAKNPWLAKFVLYRGLSPETLRELYKLENPRVSSALLFIGGVHIGAIALLDPKLICFVTSLAYAVGRRFK
jgi:hypothetical protein